MSIYIWLPLLLMIGATFFGWLAGKAQFQPRIKDLESDLASKEMEGEKYQMLYANLQIEYASLGSKMESLHKELKLTIPGSTTSVQAKDEYEDKYIVLKDNYNALQKQTKALQLKISEFENEKEELENAKQKVDDVEVTLKNREKDVEVKGNINVKQNDDLKKIEGIGPKIESLLYASGITSWSNLSNTKVVTIQKILATGGSRYQMHNPSSWPQQARLAANGNWKALEELQDTLDGGKKVQDPSLI